MRACILDASIRHRLLSISKSARFCHCPIFPHASLFPTPHHNFSQLAPALSKPHSTRSLKYTYKHTHRTSGHSKVWIGVFYIAVSNGLANDDTSVALWLQHAHSKAPCTQPPSAGKVIITTSPCRRKRACLGQKQNTNPCALTPTLTNEARQQLILHTRTHARTHTRTHKTRQQLTLHTLGPIVPRL